MSNPPEPLLPPSANSSATDYTTWSPTALISRITLLESQLRARTLEYTTTAPSTTTTTTNTTKLPRRTRSTSPSRRASPFNASLHSTRPIALKLAYLGARYNGFEHSNNNFTPLPTIEEVLWKALRKARLISPDLGAGADQSYDVVWGVQQRAARYKSGQGERLELNWDGCGYSKCGRTDRGVSAFGQVVGVTVRSRRPLVAAKSGGGDEPSRGGGEAEEEGVVDDDGMPRVAAEDLAAESQYTTFDPVADELPYVSMLNSILPPDIRILAWCPHPPPEFDARFSCRERRYRYFFTNPAFCPTPGLPGMKHASGADAKTREGWLDIAAMQVAAKKLEGLHDYRNFCKVDPSKQMTSFERRITKAYIEEASSQGGPVGFAESGSALGSGSELVESSATAGGVTSAPRVYSFNVHGSAFLWHQVRCMAAMLFLVGQGLEQPSLIDEMLDIAKVPCRPAYEMASDAPLVLWDCIFPDKHSEGEDALDWIYAGDAKMLPSLATKGDGRFGIGGIVDELWTQWRKSKIDEVLTSSLLDLALQHGDGSGLQRGGFRDPKTVNFRSQRVFDGRDTPRMVGAYVPVLEKPRLDSVDSQNARWRNRKDARLQVNGANGGVEGE